MSLAQGRAVISQGVKCKKHRAKDHGLYAFTSDAGGDCLDRDKMSQDGEVWGLLTKDES